MWVCERESVAVGGIKKAEPRLSPKGGNQHATIFIGFRAFKKTSFPLTSLSPKRVFSKRWHRTFNFKFCGNNNFLQKRFCGNNNILQNKFCGNKKKSYLCTRIQ